MTNEWANEKCLKLDGLNVRIRYKYNEFFHQIASPNFDVLRAQMSHIKVKF